MHKKPSHPSGIFLARTLVVVLFCGGIALAILSIAPPQKKPAPPPRLAVERLSLPPARPPFGRVLLSPRPSAILAPNMPTFGHPVISGIGGTGFEQAIRIDPTNADRIYTSTPGTASADTSWIWRSLDGGKTFKWVTGALPLEGKVTTCHGGGDTELAVDPAGRLYFNDLTLANFSTARSDDFGVTFNCTNTAVPDVIVDRQWYAIDGDPLNGGSIYLTNDEVGQGGVVCGSTPANNVLVMYRSPVNPLVAQTTAGIQFGPPNRITGLNGCDEGIMGNIEVSPIATTLGQPNGSGGFETLAASVKHIFVVHDNATFNKIFMARCFPVSFNPLDTPNDPSGLKCTDVLVADLGANAKTGGDFPTMAIDKAGNLYAVWEEAPLTAGVISGDLVLKYSRSIDQGKTWSTPLQIDTSGSSAGTLHENVFAWINAGDDGRVNIIWYGTDGTSPTGAHGPDDCNDCNWSLWMVQSLNAHAAVPNFTAPILASEHHIHRGNVQTLVGGQNQLSSRALGDFLQSRVGPLGEAQIAYADSNHLVGSAVSHAMYVRQNGGTGLYAATPLVSLPGITPFNSVSDPSSDGKYEAGGVTSANMPQLDLLNSSVTRVTTAPCSTLAPCYRIVMQINNLSLAPTPVNDPTDDPDPDLVWLTQWFVPSTTDTDGGKNFHVYAESNNGAALQCFVGENAILTVGGGATLTYPGNTMLPAANCRSTLGPNGNITIDVPLSMVTEVGAIDARLHEVTASTMTLPAPANSNPSIGGIGGLAFNLIDVAQPYVFDLSVIKAVSRKTHDTAGTFDIELPLTGTPGIECRRGQGVNADAHQIVVTFPTSITLSSISVSSGIASLSGFSLNGNEVVINLAGVTNAQKVEVTLAGVNNGTTTSNVVIPMNVLLGDTTASGDVNSSDVSQVKTQSGTIASASNFRSDVTVNGVINSSDVTTVKAQSGTALSLTTNTTGAKRQ